MAAFAAAALTSLTSAGAAVATGIGSMFGGGAVAATAGGIGSDAVAGGTAAAGTAATAGSSLLTPSLFGSVLQGGAGLMSAFGAARSGQAQAEALRAQANSAELDAAQQQIAGAQQQNSLKAQLVATLGQKDVAYGASGVDLSFGTPATARAQAVQDAGDALSASDDNTAAATARLSQRAALYRQMAGQASDAGDVTATGLLVGTAGKILARG